MAAGAPSHDVCAFWTFVPSFFEHVPIFWHNKKVQAHLVPFLLQPWNQPFLPKVLGFFFFIIIFIGRTVLRNPELVLVMLMLLGHYGFWALSKEGRVHKTIDSNRINTTGSVPALSIFELPSPSEDGSSIILSIFTYCTISMYITRLLTLPTYCWP